MVPHPKTPILNCFYHLLWSHETHHWGYSLRTKPSNEDYFFERRKVLNCSNAFVVAVLLQTLR